MPQSIVYVIVGFGLISIVLLAVLLIRLTRFIQHSTSPADSIGPALRAEGDRIRSEAADQARGLRQEVTDNMRGYQDSALKVFRDLREQLESQIEQFGNRLDAGMRAVDTQAKAIGLKLDNDLSKMGTEASQNRETLRTTIEAKLDDAALISSTAARELREELTGNFKHIGDNISATLTQLSGHQQERLEKMAGEIASLSERQTTAQETLRLSVEAKLDDSGHKSSNAARELREELTGNFKHIGDNISTTLTQLAGHQQERLDKMAAEIASLSERQTTAQETLRSSVEGRLDMIRTENASKLDEMRQTVDEKLQSALEKRLGESFRSVSEQLERVYQGLGEMQTLAVGVGDLKKVLSNVKTRGTWGEIQLGTLLEQFLAPDQFIRNAQVKNDSAERVEFAVIMPGREQDHSVLLPIDAKFPQEDYDRIVQASERADAQAVEEATTALANRVRSFAKTIAEKYINPPHTTDFALLFLPTEGLYAEVLRRPGLSDQLQHDFRVTLTGPTTLTAFLNALQMGFRSLTIEKRSSEVWQLLGAVRTEFKNYGDVVGSLKRQLQAASNTIDKLGTRTNVMNRKLRDVEALPEPSTQKLLGLTPQDIALENKNEDDE